MPGNPILAVADKGTDLVMATTKYMSTLPQQIEMVEELVSVSAVTTSLLTSLDSAVSRFRLELNLSPTSSFIAPLCADISRAFSELEMKVEDAKTMKVFEKNEVGLVRTPRFAWFAICGGEREAGRLRSRLYLEKYRVRVLVDAVTWEGLRLLKQKMPGNFPPKAESEYEVLRNMLPLLAERLVGVQKDYTPRLKGESAPEVVAAIEPKPVEVVKAKEEVAVERDFDLDLKKSSKISIHSMSSTTTFASISSTASSVTAINETRHEIWLLRRNEVKRTLYRRLHILGMPFWTFYDYEPASYYMKAVPSCHDEITSYLATSSPLSVTKKTILKMDEDAQWEIQKLCEAREKASSGEKVKRNWDIVALHERPRRKISAQKKWWKKGKNERVEWVLVLRGETLDHKSRVTPIKHEDPWNPKPKPMPAVASPPPQPQQIMCPVHVPANFVKRVPERKQLTIGEAETKMGEILGDLFVAQVASE